jgi:dGTP triphosphohydrolase
MLVSELDAADAERKQDLKRQKRLHQKLKQKKKETNIEKQITNLTIHNNEQESISDWIIEYDVNQVSKLTDEVRQASITMTNEDKTEKVNLILMKIKKQQEELRKLRQYVMSMLGEQQIPKSSNLNRQNSNITHDLLMAFLNQPTNSGCWLCSGKMYAEVATQCDHDNEQ